MPSITVSFSAEGAYCHAFATLSGFATDSSFPYQITWGNPDNDIKGGPVFGDVSTDGNGAGSITVTLWLLPGINDITYTVDGVTSGSVLASC